MGTELVKTLIWFNRYFKSRKNVLVVLALTVITGMYISQNYLFDSNATRYIQQQAIPHEYDIGGAVKYSDTSKYSAEIAAATPLVSVNFTVIALPHVNFSVDPLASKENLLGNASRTSLASGALLWVNTWAFTTRFGDEFRIANPVLPGVYLQAGIGQSFGLPATGNFNFSFGVFNKTLSTSPSSTLANFTAVAQNVHCNGYFDFTNSSPDFQQVLADWGFSYYVLCLWSGTSTNPVSVLPLPAYYVGTQLTVFLIKVTEISSINVENLPQVVQQIGSLGWIFTPKTSPSNIYYFGYIDQYGLIMNSINQIALGNTLETISFFIIGCIFFYWLFSVTKESRLAPLLRDITYGVSRKRIFVSYVLVEAILSLISAICADGFGALVGFVFTAITEKGSFFFSMNFAGQYLLQLLVLNLIFVMMFSLPNVVKILRQSAIAVPSRFKQLKNTEFQVKSWQLLVGAAIFALVGIAVVPMDRTNQNSPLAPLMEFKQPLNEIISPSLPFLLALAGIWLLVVTIAKIQEKVQKHPRNVQKSIGHHLQRSVAPPRQVLIFLLLIGITSAPLLASFAALQSRQAKYADDALGWVGGTFQISAGMDKAVQYNDMLATAQSAGFQGDYTVVFSTVVSINQIVADYNLQFIDPSYFSNLTTLTDNFFYAPNSKTAVLNALQENCTILPYILHSQFNLNINDTISVQVTPYSPYNGTGAQFALRVIGFSYVFPGLQTPYSFETMVCSQKTLKYFLGHALATSILFNAKGDASNVIASLKSKYSLNNTQLLTYQSEFDSIQSADALSYASAQDFAVMFVTLLYLEFAIGFLTLLINNRSLIAIQRARGETLVEYGSRYIHTYGALLLVGIGASLLFGLLGSLVAINTLTDTFFYYQYSSTNLWIPYPLVFPWGAFALLCLLFLAVWGVIQAWFLMRTRKLDFNMEFRQVDK